MKTNSYIKESASVLIIAMMTITILTMICATSLYIASQNTGASMQTSGWQQALTGAEGGIDAAIRALNQNSTSGANAWTNWKTVSTATLPTTEPASGTGSSASAPPTSSQYNYLPSSRFTTNLSQSEGATSISAWTTIDTAGNNLVSGGQWYRIRSTGNTIYPTNSTILRRVSNNRLDNDLRNTIAMNFNRKGGSYTGPTRTIEVIVNPISSGGGGRAITLGSWLAMTGGGTVDAFSSPTGQWSAAYRDTTYPALVAEGATGNQAEFANNGQTYVYGGVTYSGNPPKNTNSSTVDGQIATPDNITIPPTSDPAAQGSTYNWTYTNPYSNTVSTYQWTPNGPSSGKYTTYTGGNSLPKNSGSTVTSITANGSASSPALIVITNGFTCPGGNTFTINANTVTQNGVQVTDPTNSYVVIWVQGPFTTSGSGMINQASGAHVTWIVDGDLTVSGSSYNNLSGTAGMVNFVGVGTTSNKITDSGSGTFTGTIDAPNFSGTISGQGDFTGAIIANNLTISGSGSFHYDESLGGASNPALGNYAFASWFEDNSDPNRNALDSSGVNHPIVY